MIRRKTLPAPAPEPVDPARIREILERAALEHNAGDWRAERCVLQELKEIGGRQIELRFRLTYGKHDRITSEDLDELAAAAIAAMT